MAHVFFLSYVSALASAKAALVVIIVLMLRSRQPVLLHFLLFLYGIACLVYGDAVLLYASLTGIAPSSRFIGGFSLALRATGFALSGGNLLFFAQTLNDSIRGGERKGAIAACAVAAALIPLVFVPAVSTAALPALRIFLTLSYAYFLFHAVRLFTHGESPRSSLIRRLFVLYAFFFFPALVPFRMAPSLFPAAYLLCVSFAVIAGAFTILRLPIAADRETLCLFLRERFSVSEREAEVASCLLRGMNSRTIAGRLFISPKTVQNHIARVYRKTGVNSRYQLMQLVGNGISARL